MKIAVELIGESAAVEQLVVAFDARSAIDGFHFRKVTDGIELVAAAAKVVALHVLYVVHHFFLHLLGKRDPLLLILALECRKLGHEG